ncbi:MAG: hypothetical protein J1E97_02885 [Muribaculaceae bacterium]|nr:hypothetical protein [Muribaculaceae bacterium]
MASKFINKFTNKKKSYSRKENTREERHIEGDSPKVTFSLKDIDKNQIPPGQTYEGWARKGVLSYLLEKLEYISQKTMEEAIREGFIKIYGDFPPRSDFRHPPHIATDVKWAVIMNIKGQKGRVAGHIIDNVFYIVFLDLDHLFYKMKKK